MVWESISRRGWRGRGTIPRARDLGDTPNVLGYIDEETAAVPSADHLPMQSDLLPYLDTFLEAAERGSFTAAAEAVGLTQAAVSQRIQQLESALNTSLFRREAGRVSLIEAGQTLHEYARRILALHAEARGAVTGVRSDVTGELILAASTIPGEHLLPALLSTYRARYPKISVSVSVSDSAGVLQQLEHGEAHLGFVGSHSEHPHVEFTPFACDNLVLVVPPDHRWRRRRQVSIEEVLRQPLVQRERGSGSRVCLEAALAGAGYGAVSVPVSLELGSNEAVKEAVNEGLGVAVLSQLAVAKEVEAGQLHALKINGLSLDRELFVIRDRRRALTWPAHLLLLLLPPYAGAAPKP